MNFRTGFGFDVHRLESELDFILGGIKITHSKGCVAHSDGDVLIHAICDALLGAANLRDIGFHFPDNNNKWKNADSKIILKETLNLIQTKNYKISNIDTTIVLQSPKISPYIPEIQQTLSEVLNVSPDQISIKATTSEKLGFEGREEGVSAYANVLIYSS